MIDRARELEIQKEIVDLIAGEDVDLVLSALAGLITLQLTLVCPDCRREIAKKLTRSVPVWLAQAEAMEADAEPMCWGRTHAQSQ